VVERGDLEEDARLSTQHGQVRLDVVLINKWVLAESGMNRCSWAFLFKIS
jgi:hypothetical protein